MTLIVFWVVSAAHLGALKWDISALEFGTKALLMPLLALWVWQRKGPRLMVAGLLLSAAGDIALEFDGLFVVGMAFFAAAHVCYVRYFLKSRHTKNYWILGGYAIVWLALIILLAPKLGALQIPIAAYSLLLTTTAITSAWHSLRCGLGGALFLISDTLIAARIAEVTVPMSNLLIMATYIVAQYLLASGVTTDETR